MSAKGATAAAGVFTPTAFVTVLDAAPKIPLGYLGDQEKTERTFPVVDGKRWSVPGDRARWRADGTIEVLGRNSGTIYTGGEKVFAEELEAPLLTHPAVADVIVVSRASERWRGGGRRPVPGGFRRDRQGARGHCVRAHRPPQAAEGHRRCTCRGPLAGGDGRLPLARETAGIEPGSPP